MLKTLDAILGTSPASPHGNRKTKPLAAPAVDVDPTAGFNTGGGKTAEENYAELMRGYQRFTHYTKRDLKNMGRCKTMRMLKLLITAHHTLTVCAPALYAQGHCPRDLLLRELGRGGDVVHDSVDVRAPRSHACRPAGADFCRQRVT
jgi:hypothetical protein